MSAHPLELLPRHCSLNQACITISPLPHTHSDPFIVDSMHDIQWCQSLYPAAIDQVTGGPSLQPTLIAALYQRMMNRPLAELPIDLTPFHQQVESLRANLPTLPAHEQDYYAARADGLAQALEAWPETVARGDSTNTFICRRRDAPYDRGRVLIAVFDHNEQLDRVFLSGQDAHTSDGNQRALAISAVSIHFSAMFPWAISPTFTASPEPVSGSLNKAIRAIPGGRDLVQGRPRLCAEYALSRHMLSTENPCTQLTLWIGTPSPSPWKLQRLPLLQVAWNGEHISTLQVVGPCDRCQSYDTLGFYRDTASFIQEQKDQWMQVKAPAIAKKQSDHIQESPQRRQKYAQRLAVLQQQELRNTPVLSPQRNPHSGEPEISPLKVASRHALRAMRLAYTVEEEKENSDCDDLTLEFQTTPPPPKKPLLFDTL